MTLRSNRRFRINRRALMAGTMLALAGSGARVSAHSSSSAVDFAARIDGLLGALPARDAGVQPAFYYADLAGQLDAVGIERPAPDRPVSSLPDGFIEGALALPLAAQAFAVALDSRWFSTFGFAPHAVAQAMLAPGPDGGIAIFRGGFDAECVRRSLVASGYTEARSGHGAYFTVGDDPALDTTVGQLGLGTMNQAVVRDDLLVFAAHEAEITVVLAVLAGDAPTMAGERRVASLIPLFSPDLVGMIPVPAARVPATTMATPAATPVAAAELVEVAVGVRAGSRAEPFALGGEGTPRATPVGAPGVPARIEVRLRFGDPDVAAREANAIPRRWRAGISTITGGPLSALLELVDARVSTADVRAVAVDFVADTPNRWSQMVHTGDFGPLFLTTG